MKMGDYFALPARAERRDIYGADGWYVADCSNSEEASAAAHAINCHDALVATLEAVRQEIAVSAMADQRNDAGFMTDSALWAKRAIDRINAALAKAKGE